MKLYFTILVLSLLLTACTPVNNNNYDHRDCHYYGTCGYGHDSYWDRPPQYGYHDHHNNDDWRRTSQHHDDHDHHRDNDQHDWKPASVQHLPNRANNTNQVPRVPKPTTSSFQQVPSNNEIRPSCPAGTQYDGRHCKITDQKLRKPGGDGNINPCPRGMWVAGGKCVGK